MVPVGVPSRDRVNSSALLMMSELLGMSLPMLNPPVPDADCASGVGVRGRLPRASRDKGAGIAGRSDFSKELVVLRMLGVVLVGVPWKA